jgi:hypothetical protein
MNPFNPAVCNATSKTIDQKKRAVITRPFGRELWIVLQSSG